MEPAAPTPRRFSIESWREEDSFGVGIKEKFLWTEPMPLCRFEGTFHLIGIVDEIPYLGGPDSAIPAPPRPVSQKVETMPDGRIYRIISCIE